MLRPIPPFALALPPRIEFGRGSADTAAAAVAGFGRRVLLVRSASVPFADRLAADLQAGGCTVAVEIARGEPELAALEAALARHRPLRPEVVVAVGGGSAIDLGKALAALLPGASPVLAHLEVVGEGRPLAADPLPLVALPSTAGTGAEATRNAVVTVPAHRRKVSLRDLRMMPRVAVVDPALTDGCPRGVTLASGLDALTQLVEPYLSARANPFTDALCAAAIPSCLAALIRLMEGEDPAARDAMCHASLSGGIALANAGLGAAHALAGVLGGQTGAAHGLLCGALLAPTLRENRRALAARGHDLGRMERIEAMIGTAFGVPPGGAVDALARWAADCGLPPVRSLLGPLDPLEIAAAAAAASSMKTNPVALSQTEVARILA